MQSSIQKTEFARLEISNERQVGSSQGHHSVCYKGRDPQLDTDIVAKYIDTASLRARDEYFQEAQILYNSRHPNIVDVSWAGIIEHDEPNSPDSLSAQDYVVIVMPFYEKGSLHDVVKSKYLTLREVITYGLDFLTGLHRIHTKNLLHLDVKPQNVLIDDTGRALLSDFGTAKVRNNSGLATPSEVWPTYMPPEHAKKGGRIQPVSSKADIYQAGVTLYSMLNGPRQLNHQFQNLKSSDDGMAFMHAILDENFPDRSAYLPHVPRQVRTVVNRAMKADEADRYDSVLELMDDLAKISYSLDWRFNENPSDDGIHKQWSCRFDNHMRYFKVYAPGTRPSTTWEVETKRHYDTGTVRRHTIGCETGLNDEQEVDRFFRSYLREIK